MMTRLPLILAKGSPAFVKSLGAERMMLSLNTAEDAKHYKNLAFYFFQIKTSSANCFRLS